LLADHAYRLHLSTKSRAGGSYPDFVIGIGRPPREPACGRRDLTARHCAASLSRRKYYDVEINVEINAEINKVPAPHYFMESIPYLLFIFSD